jgi:large subunit ribosomal protein L29
MKTSEIRALGLPELKTKASDTRQELMNLRFQLVTGQLTDTSRISKTRHLVAQYEAILHERELAAMQEGEK